MHRTEIRPLFGDVDAMNVVYYGNYLRFFERGRAELMRAAGCPYSQIAALGLHMPAVEAGLRYCQPAMYDQLLAVEASVAWVKKASCRFEYRILDLEGGGERELVTGFTVHGCVNGEGKVKPLPPPAVEALKKHLRD